LAASIRFPTAAIVNQVVSVPIIFMSGLRNWYTFLVQVCQFLLTRILLAPTLPSHLTHFIAAHGSAD
jgi:hypothetical protein